MFCFCFCTRRQSDASLKLERGVPSVVREVAQVIAVTHGLAFADLSRLRAGE